VVETPLLSLVPGGTAVVLEVGVTVAPEFVVGPLFVGTVPVPLLVGGGVPVALLVGGFVVVPLPVGGLVVVPLPVGGDVPAPVPVGVPVPVPIGAIVAVPVPELPSGRIWFCGQLAPETEPEPQIWLASWS
jgi:hypothetical protein